MDLSKIKINYNALKGRIKQKYGFLTGNFKMFEEGRKEVIQENDLIKNNEKMWKCKITRLEKQIIDHFKH